MVREATTPLGQNVRAWRKSHGWTLEELAGRAGMTPSNLSQIETGKIRPRWGTLHRLADALRCSMGELLGEPVDEGLVGLMSEIDSLPNEQRQQIAEIVATFSKRS